MSDKQTMKYCRLGQSGLKISRIILGCMSYGHPSWAGWVLDEDKSLPLLKAAWDAGIQTWDTADIYSNGISEVLIAKAIKKYSIPREKLVILTKCFGTVNDDPYGGVAGFSPATTKEYINKQGLSRKHIFEAVEASLKRLEMDYIDVLQIHRYDPNTPREETMKALYDLVQMGKVRYIGASSMFTHQFLGLQYVAEKNGWTKFISMQNYYNLIYREEEREMNPACKELGVGLIPWSPMAGGALARPAGTTTLRTETEWFKRPEPAPEVKSSEEEIITRIESLSKKKNVSMAQIALSWMLHKPEVSAPIVGLSSVERMEDVVAAVNLELSDDEIKELEEPYIPKPIFGHG